MSTFAKKASSILEQLSAAHALGKQASQTIKHVSVTKNADPQGMDEERAKYENGQAADDPANTPAVKNEPRDIQGGVQDSINQKPATAIGGVTQKPETTAPATVSSKAASLRQKVASIIASNYAKQAAQAEEPQELPTATGAMTKFASYMQTADENALASMYDDIAFMRDNNPLFNQACEAAALRKFAAEADALAEATGMNPQDAASVLEASIAEDPAAAQEMQGEIEAEALGDLANAEQAGMQDAEDSQAIADAINAEAGTDLTADEIDAAVEEVKAAAAEQGVEPEELILAAAQQMQGGDEDPEAEELAAQLVQAAAQQGISPEELVEALAAEQGAEEAPAEQPAAEEAPAEESPAEEAPVEKSAALHGLVNSIRGQNCAAILERLSKKA